MSFFEIPDVDQLPEQKALPAGEYELQILAASKKEGISNKTGEAYTSLNIVFSSVAQPDSKSIYHTIFLPKPGDKDDRVNQTLRRIRAFLKAFKLPLNFDPDNLDNWVGATGFAHLSLDNDEEYGERNNIKRFQETR